MTQFRDIVHKYALEKVVFQSTERGRGKRVYYLITNPTETGFSIERLSANHSEQCTYSLLEKKLDQVRAANGHLPLTDISNTTAIQMALSQATELGISQDRSEIVDLSDDIQALEHFESNIKSLRVDTSGPTPKQYKPVILWCVLDGVRRHEIKENHIEIDWLESRFLRKLEELGEPASIINLAEAFFHLTNDLFWMLAYNDLSVILKDTPSAKLIRTKISHAIITDSYWRLLTDQSNCQRMLNFIEKQWWTEIESQTESSHMTYNKSEHELNTILYGPPGTGKTYDTMRRAVEICDGHAAIDRQELARRYKQLREENRIDFVTFHQSYGYEEFVEGIRPLLKEDTDTDSDDGQIQYECRPGVLKKICTLAKTPQSELPIEKNINLDKITIWKMSLGNSRKPEDSVIYETCLDENSLLLGYGGIADVSDCKTREDILRRLQENYPNLSEADYDVQAVDRFKNRMQIGDLVIISDGNRKFRAIARISGDYQYLGDQATTRMRQMRPVEWLITYDESLPVDLLYKKSLSQMTVYELNKRYIKDDFIRERVVRTSDRPKNHVLIIDEINRGNVSKILGELITLLEPDKRLGAPNELQVSLPYSGQMFGVPANVYVIGTMNTADRSIAFLDVALRRRFLFVEMMPNLNLIRHHVGNQGAIDDIDVANLLNTINARIELLYDRDHLIGHSYFLKVDSLQSLRDIFYQKIIPLLQEYFYGDWEKVCIVLGCPIDEDSSQRSNANTHSVILTQTLNADSLLFGNREFVDDKISCEINPEFVHSNSKSELQEFFRRIAVNPEV